MTTAPTHNIAAQLRRVSKMPLTQLAPIVGVSRQAYHKWLRGKPITPEHTATLEKLLQEYPAEEIVTITYEVHSISFPCRCGETLILKKRALSSIASGIFCSSCHEHYWIAWNEGILRNGEQE